MRAASRKGCSLLMVKPQDLFTEAEAGDSRYPRFWIDPLRVDARHLQGKVRLLVGDNCQTVTGGTVKIRQAFPEDVKVIDLKYQDVYEITTDGLLEMVPTTDHQADKLMAAAG